MSESQPRAAKSDRRAAGQSNGPSWGLMLVLLFGAILLALGIAWIILAPYIHRLHASS